MMWGLTERPKSDLDELLNPNIGYVVVHVLFNVSRRVEGLTPTPCDAYFIFRLDLYARPSGIFQMYHTYLENMGISE